MGYQKPIIAAENDLSEGVFLASGGSYTSVAGTNVIATQAGPDGNHGDNNEHYIRKYNTTISGISQGSTVKCVFQFKGPFRHAGCKHVDDSDGISYNGAKDTVTFYIHNFNPGSHYTVHVCVDPENYPQGLDLVSCSMSPV